MPLQPSYRILELIIYFRGSIAEALKGDNPDTPESEQLSYLEALAARIPTASPDLLGVILKEGKV